MSTSDLFEAGSLYRKAKQWQEAGRLNEAESLYNKAIELRSKASGSEDGTTGLWMCDLASIYAQTGRHAQAHDTLAKALALVEKVYYADHAYVGVILEHMCRLLVGQKKFADAEPVAKRLLEISNKTLSGEHRQVLEATRTLARIYLANGNPAEAEKLLAKAMKSVDTPLGPAGYFQHDLALAYQAQDKVKEAEQSFKLAAMWLEERVAYAALSACLADYASFLTSQGRAEEAGRASARAKIFATYGSSANEEATILPATLLRA